MNRAWITGITLATVAGTGTAAYAGMHATTDEGTVQAAAEPTTALETTIASSIEQLAFQAGPAGTVNISNDGTAITVASVVPSSGWTLVSFSPAGTHVEVVLTDGTQNVTFLADLVEGEVTASVSATSLTTLPPETTAATTPATPAPQPAVPPVVLVPATQPPTTAHTSSPSGSGEHEDDDDDEHEDEHESEHEEEGDD